MTAYSVVPQDSAFAIYVKGKPMLTPGKQPFIVPTAALAEAITTEWETHQKFIPSQMKLTTIAFTALDRVASQEDNVIDSLLVYIDTDTLCYRAANSEKLAQRQQEQWNPVLAWASRRFGAIWQTTAGVMPLEQPGALTEAVRDYLRKSDSMRLACACVMASVFSSLVLTLAVLESHLDAERAFELSRLEEESQAEEWGRDEEAESRAQRLKSEILICKRFLRLLADRKAA